MLEKSPLYNLIHVEEDEGGRFFFDLAVDPDEIDEDSDEESLTGSQTLAASDRIPEKRRLSESSKISLVDSTDQDAPLRSRSAANILSSSMVNDAVERVYNHDDNFLRIMSISLRRSRMDWQVDREKMIAMLLSNDGDDSEFVNLFSIDMALRGVDDDKDASAGSLKCNSSPQAPSYVLQTTRLPFSRLVWTVLDYRILGPPWRITQYLTGTMKKSNVLIHQDFEGDSDRIEGGQSQSPQDPVDRAESSLGVLTVQNLVPAAEIVTQDTMKENNASWEIAMDTVRRYLRSPDLSIRFSISLCMDAEDDDDLSFFCDDEKAEECDRNGSTQDVACDRPLPRLLVA